MNILREILDKGFIQWPTRYPFISDIRISSKSLDIILRSGIRGKIPLPKEILIFSPCNEGETVVESELKIRINVYVRGTKIIADLPRNALRIILPVRDWVKMYFESLFSWIDTLEISLKNNIESRPSYIGDALNFFETLGLSKTLFFEVASKLLGKKISRGSGKTKSPRLHLNWLACLIARGEPPQFKWIGVKGRGINNPKLPLMVHSHKVAKLLGIWSAGLSFYETRDKKSYARNIVASSNDEGLLREIHAQISDVIGEIEPSIETRKGVIYYRYRNVVLTELLIRAGARLGRKSQILAEWDIPNWILSDKKNIRSWFEGVFLVGANIRILPSKHHYELYYVRSIELISNLKDPKILARITKYGRKSPIGNMINVPQKALANLLDLKEPPIIVQERNMLNELLGERDAVKTRIDSFVFFQTENKLVATWVISIYGRNRIQKLIKLSLLPNKILNELSPFL